MIPPEVCGGAGLACDGLFGYDSQFRLALEEFEKKLEECKRELALLPDSEQALFSPDAGV